MLEHMTEDFCPGNLTSPPSSIAGSDADWNQAQLPILENMVIAANEPSRRLPESEIFRQASLDWDSDYNPDYLDPRFKNDDLTMALRRQRRLEKGRRSLLSTCVRFGNVGMQSASQPNLTTSAPKDDNTVEGAEGTARKNRETHEAEVGTEMLSDLAGNGGPQPSTSVADPYHGKKRLLDTLSEQQHKDKQRRIGSGAALISLQSTSQLNPPTFSDQSMKSALEAPKVAQDEDERIRAGPDLGVVSPQNMTGSTSTTSVSQRQKRIRVEPEEEQDQGPLKKRIKLISNVEKETQTNITHDHRRGYRSRQRQHTSANLPRTHPLVTADQPEHGREQASRNDQQNGDPDDPAVVKVPQPTPQATPSTPTHGTIRDDLDERNEERHQRSKISVWEDMSESGKHMGGEEQLSRGLKGAHPQEYERAQRSQDRQEDGTSDTHCVVPVRQSIPQLDPTTSSRPSKRKIGNEPEEASNKRIRLSTEKDLDEARQLERKGERLNQRVEVACRRQAERTQRSQSRRMVGSPDVQVVINVSQSRPQVIPTTSTDQPQPVIPEESRTQAEKGGKVYTKRGPRSKKTLPAVEGVRDARAASAILKTRARDKKELALPGLSSFLEQPRRTRSKGTRIFYELDEQGRDLTHKLRRSQRTGRSW